MVTSCTAYGCTNRANNKEKSISYHRFPNNPKILKLWLEAMKRKDFRPSKSARLCSEHFTSDDFIINFGRKTLKPSAVPTLFNLKKNSLKQTLNPVLAADSDNLTEQSEDISVISDVTETTDNFCDLSTSGISSTCMIEASDCEIASNNPTSSLVEDAAQVCNVTNDSFCNLLTNNLLSVPVIEPTNNEIIVCTNPGRSVMEDAPTVCKRKRSVPAFFGDCQEQDLNDPNKSKRVWQIVEQTINSQRKTIKYLRNKVSRYEKKIKQLNDVVIYLKSTENVTPDYQFVLQE